LARRVDHAMARQRQSKQLLPPLQRSDLVSHVSSGSSFSFEMAVKARLVRLGFSCIHGGTYLDPIQKKFRQFDVHATKRMDPRRLHLAVECKHVTSERPLLAYVTHRAAREAWHETISVYPANGRHLVISHCRHGDSGSMYRVGDWVARRVDQVVKASDGTTSSDDADVFDRCSQAINSSAELAVRAADIGYDVTAAAIVPILVVPAGSLWQVQFDATGVLAGDPEKVDRVSLFVGATFVVNGCRGNAFSISHLEIVSDSGLDEAVAHYLSADGILPSHDLNAYYGRWCDAG
jgi:hypothetical protein